MKVNVTAANDGATLKITKTGSVLIEIKIFGETKVVPLLDVQYAKNLKRNIIFYGKL